MYEGQGEEIEPEGQGETMEHSEQGEPEEPEEPPDGELQGALCPFRLYIIGRREKEPEENGGEKEPEENGVRNQDWDGHSVFLLLQLSWRLV